MTFQLAKDAARVTIPAAPGISPRAASRILEMMASIAKSSGEFRWGIRGSKLAELTQYSLSVVRRAQRHLVQLGLLERIEEGGGRKSTLWRICVDKLREALGLGHSSSDTVTPLPTPPDTAQGRQPVSFPGVYSPRPSQLNRPQPPRFSIETVLNAAVCEAHGGLAGLLDDGRPRCPSCRFMHRLGRTNE